MLHYYRDFMPTAPDELTAYAGLISMPDGTPAVGVMACCCGDLTEGERVLKPPRAFGSPVFDAIQPMPFPVMQKFVDEMSPDGTHNYWRSTFIRGLSDEVIDLIIEHGSHMESRLSRIVVQFFGGAAGRVGPADTAFSQRQSEYNVGIETQWTDATESEKHIGWARASFKQWLSGEFLGDESRELVAQSPVPGSPGARKRLPNPSGVPMRTVPLIVCPSLLAAAFAEA
jgi:hypothetical protein